LAGIYIHIPYCKQACIYCDFHFSTTHKNKGELLACIRKEIVLRKDELQNETIETIYFGGGTPSICSAEELAAILETINNNFSVVHDCEITLEANPDDLAQDKITSLKAIGINRLSIGVQSFFEEDLLWMNRAHNALQARACISDALDAGITNISVDLIFATPMLTQAKLEANLEILMGYAIPHLSCYNLTIEEKTNLHHQVKNKKINVVADETAVQQFYFIRKYLQEHGYEHYEISNYAKPGNYSKHNTAYWQREKYLGIGPSAHSYNGVTRSWNIRNNELYIKSITANTLANECEVLSKENMFNEVMLTGLRTQWGVSLPVLEKEFGPQLLIVKSVFDKLIRDEKLQLKGNQITILPPYLVMADSIASELFII
jgi:oxygen-independent coproporphyrinogen-3 oxidase